MANVSSSVMSPIWQIPLKCSDAACTKAHIEIEDVYNSDGGVTVKKIHLELGKRYYISLSTIPVLPLLPLNRKRKLEEERPQIYVEWISLPDPFTLNYLTVDRELLFAKIHIYTTALFEVLNEKIDFRIPSVLVGLIVEYVDSKVVDKEDASIEHSRPKEIKMNSKREEAIVYALNNYFPEFATESAEKEDGEATKGL